MSVRVPILTAVMTRGAPIAWSTSWHSFSAAITVWEGGRGGNARRGTRAIVYGLQLTRYTNHKGIKFYSLKM